MGLGPGIRTADGLEVGGREDARATAFHLLEISPAADVAEKEETFERFDVGAGGNHVHGDGDAERGRSAELRDEVVGGFLSAGAVGDFFAELIPLGEDLADEVHDAVGVGVVLGEDESLRHPLAGALREELREK